MKRLKDLFKKKATRPERPPAMEDDELVSAIRTVMGDSVADQVRGRMDQREEYDADVAALEEELEGMANRANTYIKTADQLIGSLEEEKRQMLKMLVIVGGTLPVDSCGTFCVNGYPRQVECPYENTEVLSCGHAFCANFCPDFEWEKVLTDRRAFLLRKRDNGGLTDEEKDELLRSADKGEEEQA